MGPHCLDEGRPHWYIEVVEALLAAGASKDHANRDGYTVLIEATDNGHTQVVEALLKAGADFKKLTEDGKTALMIATDHGHTEIVQHLLLHYRRRNDEAVEIVQTECEFVLTT